MRPPRSTRSKMSNSAKSAATSCCQRSRRARGASVGCATPAGAWISRAPRRQGRSRARTRSGSSRRAVDWRKSSLSSGAQTPNTRAYRARGVMKDGRRFGGPPKPCPFVERQ
jgi:hypothetical protein